MGLFVHVCPVLVQMLAAHTRPSPVQQLVSTEYLGHHHVQAQCPSLTVIVPRGIYGGTP